MTLVWMRFVIALNALNQGFLTFCVLLIPCLMKKVWIAPSVYYYCFFNTEI